MQSHWDQNYIDTPTALVIAEGDAKDAVQALELAQVRVRSKSSFADASSQLALAPTDLVFLEATGAPAEILAPLLDHIDASLHANRNCLIATLAVEQIDDVASSLLGPHRHLLCTPSLAERVSAITLARFASQQPPVLHDISREGDILRLQKLNDEVARIADTLFKLTRNDDGHRQSESVRDAGFAFRAGSAADTATASPPLATSAQEIRAVIRARRLRDKFFPADLFTDPAWDMLLDLFAAHLESKRVSVSSLCIAAAVPPTTALRWISTMHEAGLFERQPDPADRRRAYIGLSETALRGMQSYIQAINRAGLPII